MLSDNSINELLAALQVLKVGRAAFINRIVSDEGLHADIMEHDDSLDYTNILISFFNEETRLEYFSILFKNNEMSDDCKKNVNIALTRLLYNGSLQNTSETIHLKELNNKRIKQEFEKTEMTLNEMYNKWRKLSAANKIERKRKLNELKTLNN